MGRIMQKEKLEFLIPVAQEFIGNREITQINRYLFSWLKDGEEKYLLAYKIGWEKFCLCHKLVSIRENLLYHTRMMEISHKKMIRDLAWGLNPFSILDKYDTTPIYRKSGNYRFLFLHKVPYATRQNFPGLLPIP